MDSKALKRALKSTFGWAYKTSWLKNDNYQNCGDNFLCFLILEKKVRVQFGNIFEIFQTIRQFMFLKIDQIS